VALPLLLLRIAAPASSASAAGFRSLFAFWAGGGTAGAEVVEPPIVISVGGTYRPQFPLPVEGVGYAILPQLEGEAIGLVVGVGSGAGNLPRPTGAGTGTVGVAGRSAARLAIKAAALGDRGQVGAADVVLKGLSVAGAGVAGARGSGAGVVRGLSGEATGRHDDDEATVIAFLLAA